MMAINTARLSDGGEEEERLLDWHLRNWAAWMRTGGIALGYSACGCRAGGVVGDFDDMVQTSDRVCAMALDSVIEGLAPVESAAIYHTHLYAVYRFPRFPLEVALGRARIKIKAGLECKGLWWGS